MHIKTVVLFTSHWLSDFVCESSSHQQERIRMRRWKKAKNSFVLMKDEKEDQNRFRFKENIYSKCYYLRLVSKFWNWDAAGPHSPLIRTSNIFFHFSGGEFYLILWDFKWSFSQKSASCGSKLNLFLLEVRSRGHLYKSLRKSVCTKTLNFY